MISTIAYLTLGLAGLWVGTELIIRAALAISNKLKLSRVFVGLTILAVGTDLPELLVTITSSIEKLHGVDTSGIIIGNIIGSSFGQIFLVLGILGMFSYFTLRGKRVKREGAALLGGILLLFLFGFDGQLTRFEGLGFIIIYILYLFTVKREEKVESTEIKRSKPFYWKWVVVSLLGGLAILIFSSEVVVGNAVALAEILQIENSLVGILMLGLGTSLPELILSIGAIMKKESGLSLGNLVGSNIFDIVFVTGVGASIAGVNISKNILFFDLPFLFFGTVIFIFFLAKKRGLQKKEAMGLLAIYVSYIAMKFFGY